jgi:capsular polysaccharide biosynthesis protein
MDERYIDVSYDEDNGIRLGDAFRAVGRHLLVCLLAAAALGTLAFAYTTTQVTPHYQSSFTVYVTNRPANQQVTTESPITNYLGSGDIDASNALASTYAFIFESSEMVSKAVEGTGLDGYDSRVLDGTLVATEVEQKTPLVTVTVTADSPQDAYDIAVSLIDIAPDYISGIAKDSSMAVVESPKVSTTQSSPSLLLNTAAGSLIGFVVAAFVVVGKDGKNKNVGSKEELEERFGIPSVIDVGELLPLLPRHASRTIGVMDADGKGLAASNAIALATSFAARGARVLLIDCDVSSDACGKALGASGAGGLTDLLLEHGQASDVVQEVGQGIDFLASGRPIGDFGRRVQDERMALLLKGFEKGYDYVVAAIPSALSDDSALVLADLFGKVFLSVRAGKTRKADVAETLRRLRLADVQIVGFMYGERHQRAGHVPLHLR